MWQLRWLSEENDHFFLTHIISLLCEISSFSRRYELFPLKIFTEIILRRRHYMLGLIPVAKTHLRFFSKAELISILKMYRFSSILRVKLMLRLWTSDFLIIFLDIYLLTSSSHSISYMKCSVTYAAHLACPLSFFPIYFFFCCNWFSWLHSLYSRAK